jgi:glutamate/tyrosine decarboxylase-like PLP-dependent enzyme
VDGAYGGFAAMLPDASPELRALSQADSVAVDPHKWLYAPLEAGCALVRDPEKLREAFAYHPPYYHFGVEAINYLDYGPQNSRGFRALKVWLALQQAGRKGYEQMLADDIQLAKTLHELVVQKPELEAFTHSLSITTFRYVPRDLNEPDEKTDEYLNQLNTELLTRLQNSGEAYISNAVNDGRFVLRACIVNFRTSLADIEALPEIVLRIGREVDAELRPERLNIKG